MTGQGEQFVVDVCQWNPVTGEIMHADVAEMRTLANDMLQLSDIRMYEMNMRMFEAYGLEKHFDPGTWQRIVQLLDILAGRTDISTVLQRWEATKEENAALEAGRQAAHDASIKEQQYYEEVAAQGDCICSRFTADVPCPVHEAAEQPRLVSPNAYEASCGCAVGSDGAVNVCEKHSLS